MRNTFFIALMAVVVAGCSQSAPSEAAADAAPVAGAGDDFSKRLVSVILPPKVDLDFPFVLVGERLYSREAGGETRRGLMLEFTSGTTDAISKAVIDGFGKGGYAPRNPPLTEQDGKIAYTLHKRGAANIYVDIRPLGNRKLETEGAAGTVWLSWQVRAPDSVAAGG